MKTTLYKIIYWHPINKLLRIILTIGHKLGITKFKIPPSGKISFSLHGGKKILMETNQTSYLTNIIYWDGIFAFEYSRIFYDLVKRMNIFIDVGANIGFYSLLALNANEKIKVYAFEPATGPFVFLKKNIELNKTKGRINLYKIALSDNIGKIDFYEHRNTKYNYLKYNLGGVSSEIINPRLDPSLRREVNSTTLNKFVENYSIKDIDLIKIDTEGTENRILENGSEILEKIRPIIICETLFCNIEVQLDSLMKRYDYLFYNYLDNKLVKVDSIIRNEDNGVRDCFFIPKEKESLLTKYLTQEWA